MAIYEHVISCEVSDVVSFGSFDLIPRNSESQMLAMMFGYPGSAKGNWCRVYEVASYKDAAGQNELATLEFLRVLRWPWDQICRHVGGGGGTATPPYSCIPVYTVQVHECERQVTWALLMRGNLKCNAVSKLNVFGPEKNFWNHGTFVLKFVSCFRIGSFSWSCCTLWSSVLVLCMLTDDSF